VEAGKALRKRVDREQQKKKEAELARIPLYKEDMLCKWNSTKQVPRIILLLLVFLLGQQVPFCFGFSVFSLAMASQPQQSSSSSTPKKVSTAADGASSSSSQASWQIPKTEVGVLSLDKNADGRHVRMAILDTGCDLAARGMERTTTGLPKYLDFIDCTGDGDVDMRTIQPVTINSTTHEVTVQGVTGKVLHLPPSLFEEHHPTNSSQQEKEEITVRLGAMPLYHILPKTALRRVQEERKTKFMQRHQTRMAQAQKRIDQLQWQLQQTPSPPKAEAEAAADGEEDKDQKNTMTTAAGGNNTKTSYLKKELQETQLLLEELQSIQKDYHDAGPIMDVVLVENTVVDEESSSEEKNSKWQVLVDIHADGNLTATTPMAPYGSNHQFGTFGFGSHVTFCVQVYEQGGIVSLVCDAGSHGTHVAGIAAAYDPNQKDQQLNNGVAPGAQILACKIGDVRLASSETGTGLIRALIAAKKYHCHLINLSYGEPSWQPDRGRVAQVFHQAVHQWGMTVFTSAGNDGPALCTLGSPGTLSSCITVGAYVSPDMMKDQYSTLMDTNDDYRREDTTIVDVESTTTKVDADVTSDNTDNNPEGSGGGGTLPGASYSFSSRGPTPDGRLPDICAPGGAIAPIPRHTLQGKGQKHGTSMASPSACGAAAVLLSALKERGIDIDSLSPAELRRALVNSAIKSPKDDEKNSAHQNSSSKTIAFDPFAKGAGLVSASRALDYIMAHHGKPGQNVAFDVRIPASNNARGIFIRDALQLAGPMTRTVHVKPHFEHSLEKTNQEMEELLSFELELDLVPSNPQWVQCPQRMTLTSTKERAGAGQSFAIRMDPRGLPPGAHYATVDAMDAKDPSRGPLFQVPITIIIPHVLVNQPPFQFAADGMDAESASSDEQQSSNDKNNGAVVQSPTTTTLLGPGLDKTMEITTHDNNIDVSMRYELTPGTPGRRFLSVPAAAEWATIKVRSASPTASRNAPHSLILHAVPFARGDLHNKMIQIKRFFQLQEGVERVFHVQVKGGSTLELCLQLSWLANPAPVSVVTCVEFHSLQVRPPNFVTSQPARISSGTEFARLGVGAPFRSERINPKATLTAVHRTIVPKEYIISAASLDDRDILPPSDAEIRAGAAASNEDNNKEEEQLSCGTPVYKSLLEYSFKLADSKDDATIDVTPRIPSLFLQIYDSPVDSQLWMLQDKNGKVLGYGGSIHEAAAITLNSKPGGEYKLTLRISHPNRSVLEQLKDLPLRLSLKLSKELDCPVYSKLDHASTPGVTDDGRQVVNQVRLRRGAHHDLYVTRPTAKLPDWLQPGDVMFGQVKLDQKSDGASSLDLFYEVPPKPVVVDGNKKNDDKKKEDKKKDDDKSEEEELAESIFKTKVSHLAKLRNKKKPEAYELLAKELKAEKGDDLSLLEELLAYSQESKAPEGDDAPEQEATWRAMQVAESVDAMKSSNGGPIDEAAMAQYFGCNNPIPDEDDDDDSDDDQKAEAEKTKKEMEERRKSWRSALLTKAGAWSDAVDASLSAAGQPTLENDKTSLDECVKEMKKWVGSAGDLSNDKEKARHAILLARHARICQGKPVNALASLRKARKDLPQDFYKELTEEIVKVVKEIDGMEYWMHQIIEDLAERYPKVKPTLF
jgi:tripeptidyl-peptidase-2